MKHLLLGLVLAAGCWAWGGTSRAQGQVDSMALRHVSVSGEGAVSVEPDQAIVRLGIVTQAETPEAAREQNATASSRAMNTLRDLGIPEADIQLQTLRLQPRREFNRETRQYEERGYEATRQVEVVVDSLALLPTLVARVVQRGANRLEGIYYDLEDREAARNDALRAAAINAREKAELLAEALDAEIGRVRAINEQSFNFPRPQLDARMAMAAKAEAEPEPDAYAAGEIEVTANVQVIYDLIPRGGE